MASFEARDLQVPRDLSGDPKEYTAMVDADVTGPIINSHTYTYEESSSHARPTTPDRHCRNEERASFPGEVNIVAEEDVNDDDLPVDKGWAWVVLAGCFFNIFFVLGYMHGLSILFLEYLRVFNESAMKTTSLMGVLAGVYSISALLSMHILVGTVGVRKTLFIGAGITVLGMATAVSPTSIDFLIGTHSVLLGIGYSMIFGPSIVAVRQYFVRRYGFASAVTMAGDSLGGGIFPLFMHYLLDEYGLRGAIIILTGLSMNTFVGAAACMPLQSFRKENKLNRSRMATSANRGSKTLNKEIEMSERDLDYSIKEADISQESRFLVEDQNRAECNRSSLSQSTRNMVHGSHVSMLDPQSVPLEETEAVDKGKKSLPVGIRNLLSTLDFTLSKNPMFLLVVSYSFFNITITLNGEYLPALATEKGISQQDAALFLTILGAMQFVGILCVGVVIDKGYIRVNNLMAAGLIVVGTAAHFTHFYNSYAVLLAFSAIIGISTSTYLGLAPAAIVEFMGVEYMAKTIGFASLCHGMSLAAANPIIGSIRDSTGSYTWGYNYIGGCSYIGATLLLFEPAIRRYSNRLIKKSVHVYTEQKYIN